MREAKTAHIAIRIGSEHWLDPAQQPPCRTKGEAARRLIERMGQQDLSVGGSSWRGGGGKKKKN